mmetsp:Transcript_16094/g.44850  ORF Transcript_16094/g.44850 Transcript_16094/m.44850 type:complete len:191 (+) Transcript_16094:118-690(+)|eukprot:CAMPEP_0117668994 /NCGR_PEP_ID=MMETSP0804-20121206/11871_1 /TAXON_ID=1074897 /ORGANISM="Tetraselmis astigmatica, Strain CCMP880" /LENGTH=190 /DNA_ID=CAMNT_0005476973 /DNA_START=95 /DNA_END=667 /DNA_ORIENTATION=+
MISGVVTLAQVVNTGAGHRGLHCHGRRTALGLVRPAGPHGRKLSGELKIRKAERPIESRKIEARGFAEDAVGGFFDLSKLVSSSGTSQKSAYEKLAYRIGQDVYADFGGWHLYLRDMKGTPDLKMSQVLANTIGNKMSSNGFDERDVDGLLKGIPVTLGAGKTKVPLMQVLPSFCVQDLMTICSDFARDL